MKVTSPPLFLLIFYNCNSPTAEDGQGCNLSRGLMTLPIDISTVIFQFYKPGVLGVSSSTV